MNIEQRRQIFFKGIAASMSAANIKHATIIYEVDGNLCNTAVHKQGDEQTEDAQFFNQLSDSIDTFFYGTPNETDKHEITSRTD